jgi:GntR family transcriptional regulator/MocR family aminotransferase
MKRIAASFLPPIALDAGNGVPMYDQLSEWFRRAIIDGHLRAGSACLRRAIWHAS